MVFLWIPSLLPLAGLLILLARRARPRWLIALGWLTLWTLPALAYQTAWWVWPGTKYSVDWWDALRASPIGLWVLMGGRSVIAIFEATARDITGHRSSTMIDNTHVFLAYTAIQCAILVAILVRRKRPWRKDPVALAMGALFLLNGLLGSCWPWWGS